MKSAPITRELIQALPKSDLHLHLDGSLRLPTLIELARRYQVKLPSFTEAGLRRAVFKGSYANLKEYLRGFAYTVSVLQHDSALEQAAFELAEDNQREGVRYIEVRFAPQLHTSAGLNEPQALRAVNRGLQRAALAFNRRAAVRSGAEPAFHYGIIVCAMRYFEEEYSKSLGRFIRAHAHAPMRDVYALASLELARAAVGLVREEGLPIVGFDLAGREKGYPAADHWKAYDVAHENFLGKTVHAGEDYGPESIFQAITDLHAERLGHGTHLFATRAIRDPKITDRKRYVENLVEYIGDRRITLEVCLTSNLQTIPRLKSLKQHPFGKMLHHRLSATLCTDNRLVSGTTMTDEVQKAVDAFHLNVKQLSDILIYGFKRSFFPGTYLEKRAYVKEVLRYIDDVLTTHGANPEGEAATGGPSAPAE
jgi:adenosine deaminase